MTPTTPFTVIDRAFTSLAAQPRPPVIASSCFAPDRPREWVTAAELRHRLLNGSMTYDARDAVLAAATSLAGDDDNWFVALAAILLPGLRAALAPYVRVLPGCAADLEAEALAGLLDAVRAWDGNPRRLAARLIGRSRDRARRLFTAEVGIRDRATDDVAESGAPTAPGHPDLVLERAVTEGVISRADADLIGDTRLGRTSLRSYAAHLGEGEDRAQKRRKKAEARLAAWLAA